MNLIHGVDQDFEGKSIQAKSSLILIITLGPSLLLKLIEEKEIDIEGIYKSEIVIEINCDRRNRQYYI